MYIAVSLKTNKKEAAFIDVFSLKRAFRKIVHSIVTYVYIN